MSLIQRNLIPILVLLAVIGVGMTVIAVTSPFASGQETDSCRPGAGMDIDATNAAGETVDGVRHGDEIFISARIFKDERVCDFGGGTLTITLPGATDEYPDGTVEIPLTQTNVSGNEENIVVGLSSPFESGMFMYTVNQNDGVQGDPDDNGSVELTASAVYSGGSSSDAQGNNLGNVVNASATDPIPIEEPGVEIEIYPSPGTDIDPNNADSQSVLQGQTAYFDVVISNTGGFELSDISVASLEDTEAGEVRVADCEWAADSFAPLAVDAETPVYECSTTTEASFVQRVRVTANGTAQATDGTAAQLEVTYDDTTTVIYGEIAVGITIVNQPDFDIVRYSGVDGANEGAFTITPSTPLGSDLEEVSISVQIFAGDANSGVSSPGVDCARDLATVAAGTTGESQAYDCTGKMNEGQNTIVATIEGRIPGTNVVLDAEDSTTVEAITPGLTLEMKKARDTIRNGTSTKIEILITNGASDLTDVSVFDHDTANEDGLDFSDCKINETVRISLDQIGDLAAGEQILIFCETQILFEETRYEGKAKGLALDGNPEESNTQEVIISILSPSTDVGVSLLDGGSSVVQLVVQTVVITETNDGDSDLTGVYVDVNAAGIGPDLTAMRLDRNSPQFVASHGEEANDDDVLNPGETWEWRVVVVGVTGNVVLLEAGATGIDVTARGYGTDDLGGPINPETDAEEIETQSIPFAVN